MAIDFYGVQVTQTKRVTGVPETELLSISKVIEQIKNGTYYNGYYAQDLRPLCKQLAELTRTGQTDQYRLEKRKLPAYYFGCVCSGNNGKNIHSATGLFIADFDHFGTPENPESLEHYRQLLQGDKHTAVMFKSPSGNGLKVLIKISIDTTPSPEPKTIKESEADKEYKRYFFALQDYYKGLGLSLDESGKNINRACFFSWDNDIFVNENSKVWEKQADPESWINVGFALAETVENPAPMKPQPTSKTAQTPKPAPTRDTNDYYYSVANFEEFIKEMQLQGVHICDSYENWIKTGFALAKTFDPTTGGYYFDLISQINDNYPQNPAEVSKQWAVCVRDNDGRTGIEFIFSEAKKQGLKVPENAKQTQRVQTPAPTKTTAKTSPKEAQTGGQETPQGWDAKNPVKCAKIIIDRQYKVRHNEITRNFEYKEQGGKWERLEDNFVSYVWEQLHTQYNVKISYNETDKLFRSYAKDYTYNPIQDFIKSLPDFDLSTGNSPIEDYFSLLGELTAEEKTFVKKWFCQLLAVAMYDDKTPQLCLVLLGGQGKGKTEFLKHLLPKSLQDDYFNDKVVFSHQKDRLEALQRYWLIQFDEFEKITRNEETNADFKGYITASPFIDFRAVKQTYHIRGKRYAIQCATTNKVDIFSDDENRRYITLKLNHYLDIPKAKKIDVTPMFAEARAILKANPDYCYTRPEDTQYLTGKNKSLRTPTTEEQYFNEYFNTVPDPDTDTETARFILSANQIVRYIKTRERERTEQPIYNLSPVSMGRLLSGIAEKYQQTKDKKTPYYIVFVHKHEIDDLFNWCRENTPFFTGVNCTNKKFFHSDRSYSVWKEEQDGERAKEQPQTKTISLFDFTPEERERIEETRKQQRTDTTAPPDDTGFNPENIMLEAIKKKMGGAQ